MFKAWGVDVLGRVNYRKRPFAAFFLLWELVFVMAVTAASMQSAQGKHRARERAG
jgi:hypothetical protein